MIKGNDLLGYSGYSKVIDTEQLKDISDIKLAYEKYMDKEIKEIGCGVRVGDFDFSLKSTEDGKYLMEISCSYKRKNKIN